ncbi:hypothetical protein [Acaryochloris sp. IP29b_bin.148]|uniref:hypothetical protein n=1 Tax=Acaryochloris sp. IP29b_bin.148 TaxID=2969218 RepID=UPI002618F11C|nr:hypothetical protein [Acaryochloris sp. IP29b_bin.148]
MTLFSRRRYLQGAFATTVLASLAQGRSTLAKPQSGTPAAFSPWQLGLGEDPARLLQETQTDPAVKALMQAWSPQFLTAWLNSFDHQRGDLSFWRHWHQDRRLSQWFEQGYGLQVITWEDDRQLPTGDYHLSRQYLEDLEEIATYIRQANPHQRPTYWTLATEFSYWRLPADTYNASTAPYYQTLMANLLRARQVIRRQLPQAWVALSWGGWIVTFDDPTQRQGQSMIPPFADTMAQMDGIAFQSMRPFLTGEHNPQLNRPDLGNPAQILKCCQVFSQYHSSLMVSHYEPSIKENHPHGGRADIVTHDFLRMMQPDWLQAVRRLGLDKFSLMHYGLLKGDVHFSQTAAQTLQLLTR